MTEFAAIGWTQNPWNFELSVFADLETFGQQARGPYSVIVIRYPDNGMNLASLLHDLHEKSPQSQLILLGREREKEATLQLLLNRYPIVALLESREDSRIEDLLNLLLLNRRIEEQSVTHQKLLLEEEYQQEKQYHELLLNLKEQQQKISEIQNRLLSSLQQEKLLHDTLMIIMTSSGMGEIELRLQSALEPILGRLHLRILLHEGTSHPQTLAPPAITFELHEQESSIGHFVVHTLDNQTLSRQDLRILENISEALSLHIPRFLAFQANALLENEWRATFDAISDPLIIVSEHYQIIDANRAARERIALGSSSPQDPCYQQLFGRKGPCTFCRWNQKANLEERPSAHGEQWEMSSHSLRGAVGKQKRFIHLYRNKFEQLQMEQKISAFARAAEVGIFKASLAHELNNPIGGLLTLAQLQKMDHAAEHPLHSFIAEIEQEAFRCRDLIQNLLQQARSQTGPKDQK